MKTQITGLGGWGTGISLLDREVTNWFNTFPDTFQSLTDRQKGQFFENIKNTDPDTRELIFAELKGCDSDKERIEALIRHGLISGRRTKILEGGKEQISSCISDMLSEHGITTEMAAKAIGVNRRSFINKIYDDRFSISELIILSELCDCHLSIVPSDTSYKRYTFDAENFLSPTSQRLLNFVKESDQYKDAKAIKDAINGLDFADLDDADKDNLTVIINNAYIAYRAQKNRKENKE